MADKDLKFYDGSEWVSMAEIIDVYLPITDEDLSVKIHSASNGYINFDVGSTNNFKMDPSGDLTIDRSVVSKSTGLDNPAISTVDKSTGFALFSNDIPSIKAAGQQVQNWSYTDDAESTGLDRYQSTIKARTPGSYSELLFASNDPTNPGLRFLANSIDADTVVGWPDTVGFGSEGCGALLYKGYERPTDPGNYTPLVIGSTNSANVIFMEEGYPYITLEAVLNDVYVHVPLVCNSDLQVNRILGKDGVTRPAIEFQSGGVLFYDATLWHSFAVGGVERLKITDNDLEAFSTYEPQTEYSLSTKKYIDERTTADIILDEPVDTLTATRSTLTTQKDANQHFDEEIKKRALVVTCSQAEFDALSPPDPDTLYLIV